MSYARLPAFSLVIALGGTASFFACATGDDSFNLGSLSPVGTQSQGDDGGTQIDAAEDALNLPTPNTPTPGDDAASPPANGDSAAPPMGSVDSAAPPVVDSAAPPVVDSAVPPVVDSAAPPACPGYAPPSTTAGCTCDPTKHACTANGCYNGYYCKLSTLSCVTTPSGC